MISYDYFLTNIAGSTSEVTQRLNLLALSNFEDEGTPISDFSFQLI